MMNGDGASASHIARLARSIVDISNIPRGKLVAPAVPASTIKIVNPFPGKVRVFVGGGTVTAITVYDDGGNSTTTGQIGGMIIMGVGEGIAVTYSVLPTWSWFGL